MVQDLKDFGWINLNSNAWIFQPIMIPSAFGEKKMWFLDRMGVVSGERMLKKSRKAVGICRKTGSGPSEGKGSTCSKK